ncbi:hypothetical protein AMC83_CH02682 [Rhizobium phaseoli]|uniref:hypothetical protein n=1 Tax=Rhizobium phaseoli TaxID=396 RepID=UPI0007EB27B1|nr:hypothetical protein [Rhizobium phaseoli]ANL72648.1 hypothetical protein AMC83_CH02682 [Rhizobium phaseoli]ANM04787.1 hypothetical protein AMC78_CH02705 [Rhizobium phaseoli]MDH6650748.1 hypothetical protein [Rhizobium esperanzae]
MSDSVRRRLDIPRLRRRSLQSLGLILSVTGLASCSNADESALAEKFAASELHLLGSFCEGPYYAVRDGKFIFVDGNQFKTLSADITIRAIGSNRLSMRTRWGPINLVTTYLLKHDNTVAMIESIVGEPELTPEQWASAPGIKFRKAIEVAKDTGPFVLCPPSTPETEGVHLVTNKI